ncbi:hypothetical protein FOZ62_014012, partial [Perkinsus olseni]
SMIRRREATGLLSGAERAGVNVDAEVAALVRDALAEKTRKSYSSAANLYSAVFRDGIREGDPPAEPFPLSGRSVTRFIWVMWSTGYPYSTIRSYVSAIKTLNAESGSLLGKTESELVSRALKGVARRLSRHGHFRKAKKAKPISKSDLRRIMQAAGSSEEESLATATLLSTCALLRAEECLALNVGDVTFETRHKVDVVRLSIRGSKTDQRR